MLRNVYITPLYVTKTQYGDSVSNIAEVNSSIFSPIGNMLYSSYQQGIQTVKFWSNKILEFLTRNAS